MEGGVDKSFVKDDEIRRGRLKKKEPSLKVQKVSFEAADVGKPNSGFSGGRRGQVGKNGN